MLIVINAHDDSKETEALFFDLKLSAYDPRILSHMKLVEMTNYCIATGETDCEKIISWVNYLTCLSAEHRIDRSNQMIGNSLLRDRNTLNEIS